MSRSRSASGAVSTRLRSVIISSVIDDLLIRLALTNPTLAEIVRWPPAPPPARYGAIESARSVGGATGQPHHQPGYDPPACRWLVAERANLQVATRPGATATGHRTA